MYLSVNGVNVITKTNKQH